MLTIPGYSLSGQPVGPVTRGATIDRSNFKGVLLYRIEIANIKSQHTRDIIGFHRDTTKTFVTFLMTKNNVITISTGGWSKV